MDKRESHVTSELEHTRTPCTKARVDDEKLLHRYGTYDRLLHLVVVTDGAAEHAILPVGTLETPTRSRATGAMQRAIVIANPTVARR